MAANPNTASPAVPQPRYVTVNTRSGETAHVRINKIHGDAGYLLLDGYVDHKKGRNYNCERIFAQLYLCDEFHHAATARQHIKGDCRVELKEYTQEEWDLITDQLKDNFEVEL